MADWDPRSTRKYQTLRKQWIPKADAVCCLCSEPVDTMLPGRSRMGPSIEHTLPIRVILATTQNKADALALACDTSLWGLAHKLCQDRQGAKATNGRHQPRRSSRAW